MKVYKLQYTNKETAIADLLDKNIIDAENNYINGTEAVVEIGLIALKDATYDEEFLEVTPAVYADGYHYDIMTLDLIDFGTNEIKVNNPKHKFLGN
jgi:hypothetical protein